MASESSRDSLSEKSDSVLWDSTNKHYRDQVQRLKALEKLTAIYQNILPNATIEDTRKKINSLRSNYRKELRKVTRATQSGNDYVSQSWIFHMMQFLKKNNNAIDNNNKSQEEDENSAEEHSSNVCYIYGSPEAEEIPEVKRKKESDVINSSLLQEADSTYDTSIDAVALYWSNKLVKLDQSQRVYAEKAISDVLFEAELGLLNRHSVQINVSNES